MSEHKPKVNSPSNWLRWFDPRFRELGTWGFIINRLAGIGLTVYLFLHLSVLSSLARGAQAYDGFIALAKNPVFLAGEFLVITAVLLHGLNGLRIALTSFGVGNRYQKQLFVGLMAIALFTLGYFAVRMFGGA